MRMAIEDMQKPMGRCGVMVRDKEYYYAFV